ncbi:hypothetical protein HY949_02530 [Candidatus Gottesmanbacteria bacterium]|nr:hypothetical protein [Candidatus Gottesmanbacteria bacterium]
MIVVRGLVWDDWNKEHIYRHGVTVDEVEEVCHGTYRVIESFRKRIQMLGKTKSGKTLIIVLSPEDRNLKAYRKGVYYPVTAFEEVIV